jgi:5-methylcytosine-specific restriction endonuclease McrA
MLLTLAEFECSEILKLVGTKNRTIIETKTNSFNVRIDSLRLILFKSNKTCCCCGVEGTKIRLEQAAKDNPHFNLYAIKDNEYILMTKDHIIPKSKGGKDCLSNYQTMCGICNFLKKDSSLNNKQIKEFNDEYYKNISSGKTHKEAFKLVNLKINGFLNEKQTGARI